MTDDTDTLNTDDLRRPSFANDQGDQTADFLSREYESPEEAHAAGVDPAYAAEKFRSAGMDDLAGKYDSFAQSLTPQNTSPVPAWDSITSHPDFQKLSPEARERVVDQYAQHAKNYALTLPNAPDSPVLDDHFSQWSQVTKDRLVNPLTPDQAAAVQADVGAGPGRVPEFPEGSPEAQDVLRARPLPANEIPSATATAPTVTEAVTAVPQLTPPGVDVPLRQPEPVAEPKTVQDAYAEAGGNLGGVINAFDFVSKQPIITDDQAKQLIGVAATTARLVAGATGNTEAERGIEDRLAQEVSSWTSPEGLGQLVILKNPVARAMFAGQALSQIPSDIGTIKAAIDSGDQHGLGQAVAGAALNAVMGVAMAKEPLGGFRPAAERFLSDLKIAQDTAPTMPETAKALVDKAHTDFQAVAAGAATEPQQQPPEILSRGQGEPGEAKQESVGLNQAGGLPPQPAENPTAKEVGATAESEALPNGQTEQPPISSSEQPIEPTQQTAELGGPGTPHISEIPEAKSVSIRNTKVDEERAARGQLPLMQPARQAMGKTWDTAMQRLEKDPALGERTVTDILNRDKKEVSETDHALLLHEKIRVMNERSMEADRSADPHASEQDRAEARVRWAALEDRLNNIDLATHEAGTISGRALQFRNAIARDDYTFAGMERRARAAKGSPLTPDESAKLQAKADEIAKAGAAADEQQQRGSEEQSSAAAADAALKELRTDQKPVNRYKVLAQIQSRVAEGDSPKDLSAYIQRIALSFVRDGVTKRESLVSAVHDFTENTTGFTPRETRDAISGYGDFKPLDKEAAKAQLRSIKGESQQISKLEDMAEGQAPLKTGIERRTPSDEERALIKQVNEAKKAGGFEITDPEKQLQSALGAVKTRLRNHIADLQRQIDTGILDVKSRRAVPTDAEAEALRAKRDAAKKEFDSIFGKEINGAQRLARAKSYLNRRATELEARIKDNDFAPRPKAQPLSLDQQGLALRARVERLKEDFNKGLMQERLKSRTLAEKAQDTFVKWRRAFVLSSPITLAKLTSAALQRMTITPIEEAIGAGIGKAIPGVAEKAQREGGFNVRAEAKAITEGFTKGMSDAAQLLKTGKSNLESVFGKKDVMPRSAADFVGAIHGALKTVTKRNEFARSFEKRTAAALRAGGDVTDPMVQTSIAVQAYKDANRSIFLQDNRVVSAYKRAISALEQPDKTTGKVPVGSKLGATAARALLPVVKVPTNIVAETMQYAVGSVTGSVRLASALRKGVENLKPEQADLILRDLKKGSLGAALLLAGYFGADSIGGYYQPGKRDEADVKFGSVRLWGHNIPSYLVHNPLLECLQIGATVRRVADSKVRVHDEDKQGIVAGLMAGALGLSEEVPFAREMFGELPKLFRPHERQQFLNEMTKSFVVPQGVDWTARQLDKDATGEVVKRKPKTLLQTVETGIPGLRKNVPERTEGPGWRYYYKRSRAAQTAFPDLEAAARRSRKTD